ncbi:Hypothetical protein A7982_10218 [Minicystis rosea]|nr:Hypothetical protein A7982_10218 [Minicystis rosea]
MAAVTFELRPGSSPSREPPAGFVGRIARALAAIPAPPLAAFVAPLDHLRARLLRVVAPHARSLVVVRDRRVAAVGTALLFTVLVLTSLVPLWFVAVAPIVWGVPHIVADLRYLVARPGYHRRPGVALAAGAGIVAAGLGFGLRAGLAGAAGALLFARTSWRRRALGLAVIGALFAAAVRFGSFGDLVFAHAHNAVGFGLWWAWRRRTTRLHWLPLALFAGGSALILAGALDPLVLRAGVHAPWTGLSARSLGHQLSPIHHGPWPLRFLMLYAFAQSAHYVVWIRLLPEDDRPSETPRSFGQSLRALHADVGGLVLWASLLTMLALAIWASVSVGAARNGYIQMAFFHGYLELAAAALLWAEAKRDKG